MVSDTQLIVYAADYGNAYLVKILQPLPTLHLAKSLGFVDALQRTGWICSKGFDALMLPDIDPYPDPVTQVRHLTISEEQQLLREHGIQLPPGKQPGTGNQAEVQRG